MFRNTKKYSSIINHIVIKRNNVSKATTFNQQSQPQPLKSQNPASSTIISNKIKDDKYKIGNNYDGFICKKSQYVSDFNMTGYLFEHESVKSQYLHIDRNDSNNVFSINFRTTPFDSTGLPHILEHLSLCGSERFPIRDPFFKMVNRSMATSMNAYTSPDSTMYPFSTMNETDYHHLQKIYLDAVFKPNLRYIDFLQEGWRLENTDLNDTNSQYNIKGVVYNEMKGTFSENSSIFAMKFINNIMPDHTYGVCSGGYPLDIPNLTHKNLLDFHKCYYHPSNAKFYSYGNFQLDKTFKYINNEYMKNHKSIDIDFSAIPLQKRWDKSRTERILCRYDNMSAAPIEKQNQIGIGYLMTDIRKNYETFVLHIISELMIKGPNSRFYKNLIEPNISGGYNEITGYDAQFRDTLFAVGLQDVLETDFDKIQKIFDVTINEIIEKGFDTEHINSVLNNIELNVKHQSTQFGLGLLFNILPVWHHEGDLLEVLQINKFIEKFKENVKQNPKYLQEKVIEYFANNTHKLILTMSPDQEYEKKFQQLEQKLINDKVAKLTDEDRKRIFDESKALAETQKDVNENANILPCLSLNDVESIPDSYQYEIINSAHGVTTQLCTIDTNNISYFYGLLNASNLTLEQKLLLPLLTTIITQLGTKNYDFRKFDKLVTSKTSGIGFQLHMCENINDIAKYEIGVLFNSYCLDQNVNDMFSVINELLNNFTFTDVNRFEMLLENYISTLTVGIAQSGNVYAIQGASGIIDDCGKLRAQLGAIEHIEFMKNLVKQLKPNEILMKLQKIAETLFNKNLLKCAINCTEKEKDKVLAEYNNFLNNMPINNKIEKSTNLLTSNLLNESNNNVINCVHNIITIPVNFCSKSILTVPYKHEHYPALRVLGKLLSAKYLLPVVREQNGAYGAGAQISTDGKFSFYSYRDPNSRKTLDTFDQSLNWINDNWNSIDDQTLFEAKLGVLQKTDSPIAAGAKGQDNFKYGITPYIFNDQRIRILSVTLNDLKIVAEKYLDNNTDNNKLSGKYVLGPENNTLNENRNNEKWNIKHT